MIAFGRREQYIILVLLGVIIFGVGVKYAIAKPASVNPKVVQKEVPREEKGQAQIFVHITGAVQKPGLYQFKEGARVKEALDKAVPTEKADLDAVNLAEILTDGSKIVLPEKGQPINQNVGRGSTVVKPKGSAATTSSRTSTRRGSKTATSTKLSPGEKININTADASQLDRLPGVGVATAQKIIDYRNANGGFKSIEEIKKVAGIGEKKFADLSPYLTL